VVYATQAQALSYCGRLSKSVSGTSVPSLTDLTTFLTDRSNHIDSVLASRGLTVPVTQPAWFLAQLVALNAKGAAGDMLNAAYTSTDASGVNPGSVYQREFLKIIDGYIKGEGIPVAVAVAETDLAVASAWSGSNGPGHRLFHKHESLR
jgi:hypothetical protein